LIGEVEVEKGWGTSLKQIEAESNGIKDILWLIKVRDFVFNKISYNGEPVSPALTQILRDVFAMAEQSVKSDKPGAGEKCVLHQEVIRLWQLQLAQIVAKRIEVADSTGDDLEVVLKRRDGKSMKPKIVILPSGT